MPRAHGTREPAPGGSGSPFRFDGEDTLIVDGNLAGPRETFRLRRLPASTVEGNDLTPAEFR